MLKEVHKLYIGLVLLVTVIFVAFSVLFKLQIIHKVSPFHRSLLRGELSNLSFPTKISTDVTASLTETPYDRIDNIPEETKKLPFLKNFKNPCWREATGGKSSRIRCLPYFYLVGAAKCGTTDLHRRLIRHPKISSTVKKEIQWISKRRQEAKLSTYLRHFDQAVSTDIIPSGHEGYHDAILGSLLRGELSNLSFPTKISTDVTASLTETPYDRIDNIPEETKKLPFLKNFKNPCWREATGGKSSRIRCLPYFYLVGAAKCGTTDLHRRLIRHPKISSTVKKEIQWISKRRQEAKLSTYLRHFDQAVSTDIIPSGHEGYHDAILGDFSPTTIWFNKRYLNSPFPKFTSNADVIRHLNPDSKILVTLRNPVERTYSDFKHFHPEASPNLFHSTVVESIQNFKLRCENDTHLKPCIDQFTDHLLIGIYYVRLEDFLRTFPRKQIYITKLEERTKSMKNALKEIFSFLEIEPLSDDITADIVEQEVTAKNTSGRPDMLDKTKLLLEGFFKPYNDRLGTLIGQEYNYNINK